MPALYETRRASAFDVASDPAEEGGGESSVQCGSAANPCGLESLDVSAEGCTDPSWTRGDDGVCRSERGGTGSGTGGTSAGGGGDWGGVWVPDEDPPAIAPDGIDQAEFEKLNRVEKWLCVLSPNECAFVIASGHHASDWARERTPQLGEAEADNERDALRHTLWQALLAGGIGGDRAKAWGDAHETSSLNPLSTCMDQWNNAVGRRIGVAGGNIYSGVLNARDTGQLKTSPFSC